MFEIADRFTIFRGGRNVGTMRLSDARSGGVSRPEMMLGEKAGDLFPERAPAPG